MSPRSPANCHRRNLIGVVAPSRNTRTSARARGTSIVASTALRFLRQELFQASGGGNRFDRFRLSETARRSACLRQLHYAVARPRTTGWQGSSSSRQTRALMRKRPWRLEFRLMPRTSPGDTRIWRRLQSCPICFATQPATAAARLTCQGPGRNEPAPQLEADIADDFPAAPPRLVGSLARRGVNIVSSACCHGAHIDFRIQEKYRALHLRSNRAQVSCLLFPGWLAGTACAVADRPCHQPCAGPFKHSI